MKTRNGHVTNSSSTSFVVAGNEVELENILADTEFEDRKYIAFGKQLCEARDIFFVLEAHLPMIQEAVRLQHNEEYEFTFIEALSKLLSESGKLVISNLEIGLPETINVFFGKRDENASYSVHSFAENYPEIFEESNEN